MRKLLFLALFMFACAPLALAQDADYNKVEFFGGYSHNRVDTGVEQSDGETEFDDVFGDTVGFHGFNVSLTGNFHRYVGVKADFSGHYRTDNISFEITTLGGGTFGDTAGGFGDGGGTTTVVTGEINQKIYNFLGGLQLKDNSKEARFKPFAHVLAGGAHQKATFTGTDFGTVVGGTGDSFSADDTSFAMAIGGGIDVRVHPRVDLRLIQVDYNPIFQGDQTFGDVTFEGQTQHNFRIGVGVVIH